MKEREEGMWIPYKILKIMNRHPKLLYALMNFYYLDEPLKTFEWRDLADLGFATKVDDKFYVLSDYFLNEMRGFDE